MGVISIKSNNAWNTIENPVISVITSVYNRRDVLVRAMKSVASQTLRNIEYIVVNNGSSINIDDIVEGFMNNVSLPILYIKRDSGLGPHTGKNSAIQQARGKFVIMLDSDDELLPNCAEVLLERWNAIPDNMKDQYREVVALCKDEYDNVVGDRFPSILNEVSALKSYNIWSTTQGLAAEHVSINLTSILKKYPFPEPEGVTWVVDGTILWARISQKYRTYFTNDILKRYYVGSPDSITNATNKKLTDQHFVNMLYCWQFVLNHWNEYNYTLKDRIKCVVRYNGCKIILTNHNILPNYGWICEPVNGFINKLLIKILWLPSFVWARNQK